MANNIGVLFDLDGVLIDSESTYTEFWSDIDRRYPTGVDNFAIAIKGTTLPSILNYFPDENIREDIVRRITEFQSGMDFPVYPGARQLLQSLMDAGIPRAVVTSSGPLKMKLLFDRHPWLRGLLSEVIDASRVTKSKPDPQGYLLGAEAIGVPPESCYVFEDSLQGLAAGRAAGAKVIGVATTYKADRIAPLADRVIDTVADITVAELLQS